MAKQVKQWSMNDTQKKFVEILKEREDGVTLFELKLEGIAFSTGSINTLITKGIVETADTRVYACDIVYNGVVVGKSTRKGKVYKLVK